MTRCEAPDCDRPTIAKGLCTKHYQRQRRHGSTDAPARSTVNRLPMTASMAERFEHYVDRLPSGCWQWTGYLKPNGYGSIWDGTRKVYAHRYAHELHNGPIPAGMQIDHLCLNKACVNPAHLDVVTQKVNLLRADGSPAINARKTHCKRGHKFTDDNTRTNSRGHRVCKECSRILNRAWYQRRISAS